MKISYANNKLEKILTNERMIRKEYTGIYKKVINRMSEIRAAENLDKIPHVPPPRRHKLEGDYADCWGVNVSKNVRIVLKPIGDWDESDITTINEILILSIEDYH